MEHLPFELVLDRAGAKDGPVSVRCISCLRSVEGRRKVYDAVWDNRPVIAKVFDRGFGAERHVRKEWNGLQKLAQRGLAAPEPLFRGRTEDDKWIILMEKLEKTATLLDVLNETEDSDSKQNLLISFSRVLAKQHSLGVVQEDLHLGNFLFDGSQVYTIDPWQMKFSSGEVSRRRSISYLALFVRYLPARDTEAIGRVCEEYFKARGWQMEQRDQSLFKSRLVSHEKSTIKKSLRKCLRTSKRYLCVDAGSHRGIFARSLCAGADPQEFIRRIDDLMDAGEVFKKGNTCHVSRVQWNGRDVVIKRYNHKGLFYSLRHSFMRSRARQGWLHGHRLAMLGVATPAPLACVEQYRGPILWQSYLVTEYVGGRKLYAYMSDRSTTKEQGETAIAEVMHLLDDLDKHRISHGDLKHTNILLTDRGPALMDLDGMCVHRLGWTYSRKRAKDLAHFTNGGRGAYSVGEAVKADC